MKAIGLLVCVVIAGCAASPHHPSTYRVDSENDITFKDPAARVLVDSRFSLINAGDDENGWRVYRSTNMLRDYLAVKTGPIGEKASEPTVGENGWTELGSNIGRIYIWKGTVETGLLEFGKQLQEAGIPIPGCSKIYLTLRREKQRQLVMIYATERACSQQYIEDPNMAALDNIGLEGMQAAKLLKPSSTE